MSAPGTTTTTRTPTADVPAAQRRHRSRFRLGDAIIPVLAALAFVYLLVPIAYTVAFSFNDSIKSNLIWRGFTWDNWADPCGAPEVCEAFTTSLEVGATATLAATALGTLLAVALVRFRFRGRSAMNLLIFLPMSTPEVVLGSALAAQFLLVRATYGFWTIVAAHVLFCISFVVVTVKARVASLDPALEEAAADLYASPAAAFWRVTFPLLLPGIAAAALLSFSLSFDDYIVTNFNAGSVKTFPMFVYISANRGIPPQANVLATIMFMLALIIVVVAQVLAVGRRRRDSARARRASTVGLVEGAHAPGATDQPSVAVRMPARPTALVARPRPQVAVTTSTVGRVQVPGLSVQGHRPTVVVAVGLLGIAGGVLGMLTALVRIPNAYDADLDRWLVILSAAVVVALVSTLLLRGSAVWRIVCAAVVGGGVVGLVLALTVFDVARSLGLVGLAVAVACFGLVFKAPDRYFGRTS